MPKIYENWTEEMVIKLARNYRRFEDFARDNRNAQEWARRHGLLDVISSHMEKRVKRWTANMIKKEALKYNSRMEFMKLSKSAYNAAGRMGIKAEVCSHMPALHQSWTLGKLREVAQRYNTLTEFRKRSSAAYQAARNMNMLGVICAHMPERTRGGVNNCVYVYVFRDAQYVGLSANRTFRFRRHLEEGPVASHAVRTGQPIPPPIILYDNLTTSDARRVEREEIRWRRHGGVALLNRRPGGEIGSWPRWNRERAKQEALKYGNRREFQRAAMGAYLFAWRENLLDDICSHMPVLRKKWTSQDLLNEATKYKSRKEFEVNNGAAYAAARKRGILDEICVHMVPKKHYWSDEELATIARGYASRSAFKLSSSSSYTTAIRRGILARICEHMPRRCSSQPQP
jgi:hypothetical protein